MRERQPAICIRATDYSETSQVVHFFTRGCGTVHLIARGAKRPKSSSGGAIDLLTEGDLVFSARSVEALGTLIEFSETASHGPLRKDAARLNAGLYMIELVGEMFPAGDPHAEVFDLLRRALSRLESADAPVQAVLAYFQLRTLRHAGLLGDLRACVSCGGEAAPAGSAAQAYFSSREGGLLCAACESSAVEKYRVDGTTLSGLAALTAAEGGTRVSLPEPRARAVNRLLAYHVREQLGKPLRMARYTVG